MPKVSDAHREGQRAEILDAARACFAAEGFHATSMQDILAYSGKSAGAVYGYFASKSDLVAAIAAENVDTVLGSVSDDEGSALEVVLRAVAELRRLHEEYRTALISVQVWAESARDPVLQEQFRQIHLAIHGALARLLARRDPQRADALAGAICTMLPGYIVQLALLGERAVAPFEEGVRLLLEGL